MKTIYHPGYAALIDTLKSRRLKLKLTQADVAAKLSTGRTRIAKWEARELRLDVLDYSRLCSVLGVEAGRLLKNLLP